MVKKRKRTVRKAVKPAKARVKKAAKSAKIKPVKAAELKLEKIGEVTHYFPRVKAAAVKLIKSGMTVGDNIYIKGHTTDFKEKVRSMQLDHVPIDKGRKAQEIGLLVKSRVRIGDSIYKV